MKLNMRRRWWAIGLTLAGLAQAGGQPVIVTSPQPQQVPLGGTTTFLVEASGAEPLSYQWFRDSLANPVPGGTNTFLVISNATVADAGLYRVRVTNAMGLRYSASASLTLFSRGISSPFGILNLAPALDLNGMGTDVDSIAFWETPDPNDTLMFVTAKGNNLLEVYKYPFQGNELPPRTFSANVNGVAVDQETDLLYVSDSIVSILSLPSLQLEGVIGQGIIGVGENNLDILKHTNGQTIIYVSDDHNVHRFDAATHDYLGSFAPPVASIETIQTDDFYQMILVPDEQGASGNPGVYAYHPDGAPYLKYGSNRFGNNGEFDSDEEGILLYTFPSEGATDDGTGFIVVADQRSDQTDYEFFDRQTWSHLGTLRVTGVSNTDGIASTQRALPNYPLGLFATIDDDTSTVVLGWDVVIEAIEARTAPRVIEINPASTGPVSGGDLSFTILFSKPVTNFNNSADLVITHRGTAASGATISGSNANYTVTLTGISGAGFFTAGIVTTSDVRDLSSNALASSVTSVPIFVGTAYEAWAFARGLVAGVNDGFSDDPDGDQQVNLREFATDNDPLSAAFESKQRIAIEEEFLTYTLPIREGAAFINMGELSAAVDGIVYSLRGGSDPAVFDEEVVELDVASDVGLPQPHPGWSYRTFRLNRAVTTQSAGFIRLVVGEL